MKLPVIPTNSLPLRAAKVAADLAMWGRVGVQRTAESALLPASSRPVPRTVPLTGVLRRGTEVEAACREARALRLPLHPTRENNWDALGAVRAVVERCGRDARVLDGGAARYSTVLPSLRLYGLRELAGINPEFARTTYRGPVQFRNGDITATGLPAGALDAVTCLSVIEYGVDVPAFLTEAARVLRPGGLLVVSTGFDRDPPDPSRLRAYGRDVRVYGPGDVRGLVGDAAKLGLRLFGQLDLEHKERPVHSARTGLDHTFVLLSFEKVG